MKIFQAICKERSYETYFTWATRRSLIRYHSPETFWSDLTKFYLSMRKSEVNTMNWDQVQGNWKQLKGKAKQTWGNLTDQEIDVTEGKRKELASRIHEVWAQQKADRGASRWVGEEP